MMEFPLAFLERMRQMLKGEYDAFFAALNKEPERSLRVNTLREGAEFWGESVPWEPDGRYVPGEFKPGGDLAHFSGAYYMQDASAMAPARVLHVQPGERVLDLCAAPGGKAGQLAAALRGQGILVANEPDAARAKALSGNLERLGVMNSLVVSAMPDKLAKLWPGAFDAILVDAPCSGEGMFRRDREARVQWSEGSPAGCALRQMEILGRAAAMLRLGGRLCYSTCTFNVLENERVIRAFLEEYPEFEPMDFELPGVGRSQLGMLRLWPHKLRGEGHFVALLRRRGVADMPSVEAKKPDPAATYAFDALKAQLPGSWSARLMGWRLELHGDALRALPLGMPVFDGIKVLRVGLSLCRLGKDYVKPDHALAMALSPKEVERALELDARQAAAFLRGHELDCDGALSGWTLVTHRNMPLGWGKAAQGKLKNHIPKGLRLNG